MPPRRVFTKAVNANIAALVERGNQALDANGGTDGAPVARRWTLMDAINEATGYGQNGMAPWDGPAGGFHPLPRDPADDGDFGPMHALVPEAIDRLDANGRTEPRVFQYQVGFNLPGAGSKPVPWQVLRMAADGVGIIRRCLEVRKKDIRQLRLRFQVSEEAIERAYQEDPGKGKMEAERRLRERFQADIDRLADIWCNPSPAQTDDLHGWINAVLEDALVLDAVAIYPRRDLSGRVIGLEYIDGSTIKPLLDSRGARPRPPFPAFQQILYGFPRGEWVPTTEEIALPDGRKAHVVQAGFTNSQLFYHVSNPRSFSPYGLSPVEQALFDSRLYLQRAKWMLAEYEDGSTPLTWIETSETKDGSPLSLTQQAAWEKAFNGKLAGNTRQRHRAKVLPNGWKAQQMDGVDERYKPDYDLYLIKLVGSYFGVTATRLGFGETNGLGGSGFSEAQMAVTGELGLRPDTEVITDIINKLSRSVLDMPRELVGVLVDPATANEKEQVDIAVARQNAGQISVNEARQAAGQSALPFAEADMPFVLGGPQGIIFLDGAKAQLEQAAAQAQMQAETAALGTAGKLSMEEKKLEDGATARKEEHDFQREQSEAAAKLDKAAELDAFRRWMRKRDTAPHRPFLFKAATPDEVREARLTLDPAWVDFEGWEFAWDADIEKAAKKDKSPFDYIAWNASPEGMKHPKGPNGRWVKAGSELHRALIEEGKRHAKATGAPSDSSPSMKPMSDKPTKAETKLGPPESIRVGRVKPGMHISGRGHKGWIALHNMGKVREVVSVDKEPWGALKLTFDDGHTFIDRANAAVNVHPVIEPERKPINIVTGEGVKEWMEEAEAFIAAHKPEPITDARGRVWEHESRDLYVLRGGGSAMTADMIRDIKPLDINAARKELADLKDFKANSVPLWKPAKIGEKAKEPTAEEARDIEAHQFANARIPILERDIAHWEATQGVDVDPYDAGGNLLSPEVDAGLDGLIDALPPKFRHSARKWAKELREGNYRAATSVLWDLQRKAREGAVPRATLAPLLDVHDEAQALNGARAATSLLRGDAHRLGEEFRTLSVDETLQLGFNNRTGGLDKPDQARARLVELRRSRKVLPPFRMDGEDGVIDNPEAAETSKVNAGKPIQAFTVPKSETGTGKDKVYVNWPDGRSVYVAKDGKKTYAFDVETDERLIEGGSIPDVFRKISAKFGVPVEHEHQGTGKRATHGGPDKEELARQRQARFDEQRKRARFLADLEETALVNEGPSAAQHNWDANVTRFGVQAEEVSALREWLDAGDTERLIGGMSDLAASQGITRIGGEPSDGPDQLVRFNKDEHRWAEWSARTTDRQGMVNIVRPGFKAGDDVLERAIVQAPAAQPKRPDPAEPRGERSFAARQDTPRPPAAPDDVVELAKDLAAFEELLDPDGSGSRANVLAARQLREQLKEKGWRKLGSGRLVPIEPEPEKQAPKAEQPKAAYEEEGAAGVELDAKPSGDYVTSAVNAHSLGRGDVILVRGEPTRVLLHRTVGLLRNIELTLDGGEVVVVPRNRPIRRVSGAKAGGGGLSKAATVTGDEIGGGEDDPKAQEPTAAPPPPPPDTRWPAWLVDTLIASAVASAIMQMMPGLPIGELIRLFRGLPIALEEENFPVPLGRSWRDLNPYEKEMLAERVTAEVRDLGWPSKIEEVIAQPIADAHVQGELVGQRVGQAVMEAAQAGLDVTEVLPDGSPAVELSIDWDDWTPGHPEAAQLLLEPGGLARLLAQSRIVSARISGARVDRIGLIIGRGLANGDDPHSIARELNALFNNYDWAYTVALTETNRAVSAASVEQYRQMGAAHKQWMDAHDQRVCPICRLNAQHPDGTPRIVPIDELFPSGDPHPPGHPRCRCAPLPVLSTMIPTTV